MVAVLISFTVPTALFIIIVPRLVTVVIAGKIYAAAAPILQLYMITGIFRPIQNQSANLLNSIGKPRLVFFANILTLIFGLSINYFCLLKIGFYGAAIGTLITSMLSFVFWYFVMRKEVDLNMLRVLQYTKNTYQTIYRKLRSAAAFRSK
jgi:lipopolysaccharide exporter